MMGSLNASLYPLSLLWSGWMLPIWLGPSVISIIAQWRICSAAEARVLLRSVVGLDKPLADIALASHFYDQRHFTNL